MWNLFKVNIERRHWRCFRSGFIRSAYSILGLNTNIYTTWKVSVFGVVLVGILPRSDWIRKNTDQNNSKYGHFLHSDTNRIKPLFLNILRIAHSARYSWIVDFIWSAYFAFALNTRIHWPHINFHNLEYVTQ